MRLLLTVVAACGLALVASPAVAESQYLDPIVVDPGYQCVTEPCNSPQPIVICPPVLCRG